MLVLIGVFAIGFHYVNLVYGIEADEMVSNRLEELMVSERETLPFLALPLPFCQRLMLCLRCCSCTSVRCTGWSSSLRRCFSSGW